MPPSKSIETKRSSDEKPVIDTGKITERQLFFSVCIPTYNRANFLPQAIESVLAQDFTDFELIICDNASTDNTQQVVENYQDKRIRYVRYEDLVSMYANHNRCIELSTSHWLLFVHSDDHIEKDTLYHYYQAINDNLHQEVAIYFSQFSSHPYSKQPIIIKGIEAISLFLHYGFFPPTCNVFNVDFLKTYDIFFDEKTVFSDAILLCQICLEHDINLIPVPSVKQTWDMYRGSYKNILSSYDNVRLWEDIAFYLKQNLTSHNWNFLLSEIKTWDANSISHFLYRFSCIGWWDFVDKTMSDLSKCGIEFKSGHYYKHVLIFKFLGKDIHKLLYSFKKYHKFTKQLQ